MKTQTLAPENDDRADRAADALEVHSRAAYATPDDEEAVTRVGDLICNLLHLVQREGQNPMTAVLNGLSNYLAERADPDGLGPDIKAAVTVNGFDDVAADLFPKLDALANAQGEDEDAFAPLVAAIENRGA